MSLSLVDILTEIAKEKGIKFDLVIKAFKEVIMMAIRKKYLYVDDIRLDVNPLTGEIKIFMQKKVVNFVTRDGAEITVSEARSHKINPQPGDVVEVELPFSELGRNAAITAKQALLNKVREVEKESIADEVSQRIGELFTGTVQKIEPGYVLLTSGKAEFNLPSKEQIPGELYTVGQPVRFVLSHIQRSPHGSMLIGSRASAQFLKSMLEIEIPEVFEGAVRIKKVVREAGIKSKIAVYSDIEKIDPVGACVGMRGARIQAIMEQLNHERMDVLLWSSDTTVLALRALTPGKPKDVIFDREHNRLKAIIPDDQVSITLGKGKANLKLASQLVGYPIDLIRESEYQKQKERESDHIIDIHEISGIGQRTIDKLISAGFDTVQDLMSGDEDALMAIPGLGEKTIRKILDNAKELLDNA
ncbi:MAG: transcription termination factor NusA [Candidatus Delongbacteria bacterium]|nr:transcription termination factor NusA [Candidatus Delongbacteria bacterium]